MLGIEMESQNLTVNSLQTNAAGTSRNSQDPGKDTYLAIFGELFYL